MGLAGWCVLCPRNLVHVSVVKDFADERAFKFLKSRQTLKIQDGELKLIIKKSLGPALWLVPCCRTEGGLAKLIGLEVLLEAVVALGELLLLVLQSGLQVQVLLGQGPVVDQRLRFALLDVLHLHTEETQRVALVRRLLSRQSKDTRLLSCVLEEIFLYEESFAQTQTGKSHCREYQQ